MAEDSGHCLECLIVEGRLSKKRIGYLVTGVVIGGIIIWLVVLSTLVKYHNASNTGTGNVYHEN